MSRPTDGSGSWEPIRLGCVVGVVCGVPFGVVTMIAAAVFLRMVSLQPHPLATALMVGGAGVLSAVAFGAGMGALYAVAAGRASRSAQPLRDVPRAVLRRARRLVRAGTPGADPELNRIGRSLAHSELAFPYLPRTHGGVFLALGALNAWQAVRAFTSDLLVLGVLCAFGTALFAALLCVLMPVVALQRRRAREFLAGTEPAEAQADGHGPE